MLRAFRVPRMVWVFWLLLAVLPLRGLAHELMAGAQGPAGEVLAVDATPCHGHAQHAMAGLGTDAAEGTDTSAERTHGAASCELCGLCHGALALASVGVVAAAAPQTQAVPPWAASPHGRPEAEPFFRPPRS